jgi:DnaK suppressor protein
MATSKTAKPAAKATKPAPKTAPKAVAKPAATKATAKPVAAKTAPKPAAKAAPAKNVNNGSSSFQPYVAKKGEEYMSKAQLAHFANILGSLKADLMADIERTVHTMQDEQTVFADPNDRASQETDMALELRNRDRERKLVKKIEQTISRIKADDYGYCDKCGIEIGIQRLEARPTATLCIDCKTLEELREKQTAK